MYEGARPEFPGSAIDWLCEQLRITSSTRLLDLAAGTGRSTRPLYEHTHEIVAVEPVPEMREVLRGALPAIEVLDGTAEQIPLPDASVDVVVVAQAFHWFDAERALAEISRVLRPDGMLGLAWHSPDRSDPLQEAFRAIVEQNRNGAPIHLSHDADRYVRAGALIKVAETEIRDVHAYDADRLVALALSTSHFASLDGPRQAVGEREIRALVGPSGTIELPYEVELSAFAQAATTSH